MLQSLKYKQVQQVVFSMNHMLQQSTRVFQLKALPTKGYLVVCFLFCLASLASCTAQEVTTKRSKDSNSTTDSHQHKDSTAMKDEFQAHLSDQEYDVLVNKATDRPGEGGYTNVFDEGVYHCRACGSALYRSESKFHSGCGWPSFDSEIPHSVTRHVDRAYGMVRTEIVCAKCGGHLGHEFEGEHFTATNTRHCVNTSSIVFHPKNTVELIVHCGSFRDAQYALYSVAGVLQTEAGYVPLEKSTQDPSETKGSETNGDQALRVLLDPRVITVPAFVHQVKERCAKTSNERRPTVFYASSEEQAQSLQNAVQKEQFEASVVKGSTFVVAASEDQHYLLRVENSKKR